MIPSPRAVYRDVSKLLPGQVRVWRKGEASARFYWQMPYQDNNSADFDDLRRQFRNLLPEVVGAAGTSGGRVGCFLSGGTDSSSVSGTWRRCAESRSQPIPSVSMPRVSTRWSMRASRAPLRDRTARVLRHRRTTWSTAFRCIAAYCDEPFGNASIVPTYLCARLRREDGIDPCSPAMAATRSSAATSAMPSRGCSSTTAGCRQCCAGCLSRWCAARWGRRCRRCARLAATCGRPSIPLPDRFERPTTSCTAAPLAGDLRRPVFLAAVET